MAAEIPKTYQPESVEQKWYAQWMANHCFRSLPDEREAFTIVIPPPNVTGVLHMGHMLNNTIQDVLIRRARMQGKNACWVPGTDHASIATEAKVVAMLREKGIKKGDLGREEFLKHAWEWKEKYGGIILEQLKRLGASCDWERTSFTMDSGYYQAVIDVFVDLFNKGHIYRGLRMVNWDCEARTTVSNEEVIYKEEGEKATLYTVRYAIADSSESILIATQRPETIMGDTAIAVHPEDERYRHLIGKMAIVPIIERHIPIIADDYVDREFGTGCLKVTPAHDPNDYEIGLRHQLPIIDTLNEDGTLNALAETPEWLGLDRFVVRKKAVEKLQSIGLLAAQTEVISRIGRSERTQSVIEPKLSMQWFIRMKDIAQPALQAVENDEVVLHPAKFKNTYRYWMENVRDWCISRQLWWGHRIPAWYKKGAPENFVVARNAEAALRLWQAKDAQVQAEDLEQDPDVLDTWASSWLWPMAVFNSFDALAQGKGKLDAEKDELGYYYPTQVLVTAPEILFFWVARMIIAGYEYTGKAPFKDVYLTGIVRDKLGRKMSKSLGNSPDPLDLIAKYGADGVRMGMLLTSPAGNDLPFDESLCEQGRNFNNKIWNAFRLVKGWVVDASIQQPATAQGAIAWFEICLQKAQIELEDDFCKFRLSEALMRLYKLVWDDFCAWYLEAVKPPYGQPIDVQTYAATVKFFKQWLQWLHPFVPFITEEIWQYLRNDGDASFIMLSQTPKLYENQMKTEVLSDFQDVQEVVSALRNIRQQKQISPKAPLAIAYVGKWPWTNDWVKLLIEKMANTLPIETVSEKSGDALSMSIGAHAWALTMSQAIDREAELQKINEELKYFQGFKETVLKKLSNERFVTNAKPEVVAMEQKKLQDAEARIAVLENQIKTLG